MIGMGGEYRAKAPVFCTGVDEKEVMHLSIRSLCRIKINDLMYNFVILCG